MVMTHRGHSRITCPLDIYSKAKCFKQGFGACWTIIKLPLDSPKNITKVDELCIMDERKIYILYMPDT